MSAAPGLQALIEAMRSVYGEPGGQRAMHRRGYCAVGFFAPHPDIARIVDTPLLRDGPVPATVRFSVGGEADASEKSRSLRGMAVRLHGRPQDCDLVLISEPAFYAATPVSFLGYLQARVPDPATGRPDPRRLAAHDQAFPEAARHAARLAAHPAPASYATTPYFSNHALLFTDSGGKTRAVRLLVEPVAGVQYLSPWQEQRLPDAFLEGEMDERLLRGPIRFRLLAQLQGRDDPADDPSAEWQGAGKVPLGMLLISALADDDCDAMVFTPTRLPPGIAPGDDPILRARAEIYALASASRRR
ncbi:catalase [Duganella callida]|nr:catalase [Duganella callida]